MKKLRLWYDRQPGWLQFSLWMAVVVVYGAFIAPALAILTGLVPDMTEGLPPRP